MKVANSSCVICQTIHPRNQMVRQTINVESGSSAGAAFSPSRKKSTRVSFRQYQRKQQRWVCGNCWRSRPNYFVTLLLSVVAGPIFIPIYSGYGRLRGVAFAVTGGGFVIGWLVGIVLAFFGSLENADRLPNSRIF